MLPYKARHHGRGGKYSQNPNDFCDVFQRKKLMEHNRQTQEQHRVNGRVHIESFNKPPFKQQKHRALQPAAQTFEPQIFFRGAGKHVFFHRCFSKSSV